MAHLRMRLATAGSAPSRGTQPSWAAVKRFERGSQLAAALRPMDAAALAEWLG